MDKVHELRKTLHDIPELSGMEIKTAETIKNFLKHNTSLKIVDMGTYFYAVHYEGKEYKNIAFRADMDAIPGENGAYHGCGHDGHSAALAGLALRIDNLKLNKNIFLLFQPAEEIGKGAEICLKMLDIEKIDEIYGWHNIPQYKEGQILLRNGSFACASKGITIKFAGKQCHAAYPETGINPSFIIARLVEKLDKFIDKNLYSAPVLATIVNINVGSVNFGISAGYGEVSMTLRAQFIYDLDKLLNLILEFSESESKKEGIELSYDIFDEFPDTVNDDSLYLKVRKMLEREGVDYMLLSEPLRWSEDFGYYAKKTKGFFYGIGAGTVNKKDMYGYELVAEVSRVVDVNEGTIYPLLKRLTNEHYFETYLRESTEGPPRKYYHLTAAGKLYMIQLEDEWNNLQIGVNSFLKEQGYE